MWPECAASLAEWSKKGRLNGRFSNEKNPFYVRSSDELENTLNHVVAPLHNHNTNKQNDDVVKKMEVIINAGDYDVAKKELKKIGLDSEKRNYNVLKPDAQSPTVSKPRRYFLSVNIALMSLIFHSKYNLLFRFRKI
ncbi:MAG: hypothetical protein ACKOE5_08460 [Cytophagales bacterium]